MAFCSHCGAAIAPGASFCSACGHAVHAAPAYAPAPAAPPAYAPSAQALGKPITQGVAILALVLNIIVWPGLGSLIAGEQVGWAQGFLMLLGLVLILTIIGIFVGIPLMIGMWVWGIVTGVQLIDRANRQAQAQGRPN